MRCVVCQHAHVRSNVSPDIAWYSAYTFFYIRNKAFGFLASFLQVYPKFTKKVLIISEFVEIYKKLCIKKTIRTFQNDKNVNFLVYLEHKVNLLVVSLVSELKRLEFLINQFLIKITCVSEKHKNVTFDTR